MLRMVIKASLFVVVSALVGCGSLHHAMTGQGQLLIQDSKFDGAKIIEITPSAIKPLDSGMYSMNTLVGATWSSEKPELIQLNVEYSSAVGSNAYTSFRSIEFNLDGDTQKFNFGASTDFESSGYNSVTNTIYTESSNSVVIPYSYFEQILASKKPMIRVTTSDGVESGDLSVESDQYGVQFALAAFRTLQIEIEKAQ